MLKQAKIAAKTNFFDFEIFGGRFGFSVGRTEPLLGQKMSFLVSCMLFVVGCEAFLVNIEN